MCFSVMVHADLSEVDSTFDALKEEDLWQELQFRSHEKPKDYMIAESGQRFFCGDKYYAPIYYKSKQKIVCEPMRYGKYYPPHLRYVQTGQRKQKRCNYNTRLDNINSPAWADAYEKGHGFLPIHGFYENVLVKDLLGAGVVTLEEVKQLFQQKMEKRKEKIVKQGKKYSPTKTELKDPQLRSIVIDFKPKTKTTLLVPVIFNADEWEQNPFKGFSIITDEPTKEIAAAGHDRSPIIIEDRVIHAWLEAPQLRQNNAKDILSHKRILNFHHELDRAL